MKRSLKKILGVALSLTLSVSLAYSSLPYNSGTVVATAKTKVKLNKTKATLYVGDSLKLKITGTKKKVKWSTNKKKIATVSKKGVVKAKKEGNAKITAKVGKKKYVCKITVESTVTSVVLDKSTLNISVGDSETLQVSIFPVDTTADKTVTWSSSNTSVATVEYGIVKGVGVGTANITAKVGNKEAICIVQVNQAYGSVSGNITYYYNDYKGNVADTGAVVILIPTNGIVVTSNSNITNLSTEDIDIPVPSLMPVTTSTPTPTTSTVSEDVVTWSTPSLINNKYNQYNIHATSVDGTGTYTFQNIPTGEYKIFVISENTTDELAFKDIDQYHLSIKNLFNGLLNDTDSTPLSKSVGCSKYTISTISINKNQNTVFSHDFWITYF